MTRRLSGGGLWAVLGTLGLLVLVNVPELGSDPWPFRTPPVNAEGLLAPLVRAAGESWDLEVIRAIAVAGGLLVAVAATLALRLRAWAAWTVGALCVAAIALLLFPPTLLQMGLRRSTEPWFHVNDSTYQIELAGELILDGENPYGHDYSRSGLERFYSRDGTVTEETRREEVALRHLAYFPGPALSAAAWRLLPAPLDDYRLFVALTTLAAFFAALLFRAPLGWTIAAGAVLAANPLAVRAAWFGTADAPSILLLVVAFALVTRSRYVSAGAALGGAILFKQFALVALPFLAVMLLVRGVPRPTLWRAGGAAAAVVAAGILPFLVADPVAFWEDTLAYGTETYRIVGYGLSSLLVEAGLIDDRRDDYPFVPIVLVTWLPLTAWLLWSQWRSRALWAGAAGFAVSMFVLIYVARVFQHSYLVWPLAGIVLAAVLAASEREAEEQKAG